MYVGDPDKFIRKWKKFTSEGVDKLLVIADFDYTLTAFHTPEGEQGASSHGILMMSDAVHPDLPKLGMETFERFYPIEQSTTLTDAEKLPHILEWWHVEHELLVQFKLTKQILQQAVKEQEIHFRPGFHELFRVLEEQNVPALIFSAGLYDVIHEILDQDYTERENRSPPRNVHVVSNMMRFSEDGTLTGFDGKLIHSMNKNAGSITDTAFWQQCLSEKRRNVLLLGDSPGDVNMAKGLDCEDDEILRIGFLNAKVSERLEDYLERYDVVLTGDATLFPVELFIHQAKPPQ